MSHWTHVIASYEISTTIHSQRMLRQIKKILESAPKITGAEGNAQVTVVKKDGYNVVSYYANHRREYQTNALIVVNGDLRDREYDRTRLELDAFETYLKSEFYIERKAVSID